MLALASCSCCAQATNWQHPKCLINICSAGCVPNMPALLSNRSCTPQLEILSSTPNSSLTCMCNTAGQGCWSMTVRPHTSTNQILNSAAIQILAFIVLWATLAEHVSLSMCDACHMLCLCPGRNVALELPHAMELSQQYQRCLSL